MLHPCYWPEVRRGSERFIHDLGLGLSRLGHRPGLITSHPGARQVSVEDGLEVIRNLRPRGARAQIGLRGVYLTHLPASRRALRERDPAIGHALYPTDGLVVNRWARGGGGPAVFSVMGLPDSAALRDRPLWRAIIGRALRGADAAVALSARAAARIDELFGVECRVIHPGVDLGGFRRSAERAPAPTIFCPADLHDPRKRVELLVDAFELLRREQPEATLVLSRPPPGAPPFGGADIPGVVLADLAGDGALPRAYSAAWVTALPSKDEAFGLVLLESLACGTPVVGSADGGASEIVDSAAIGELMDGDDPARLRDALERGLALSNREGIEEACRSRSGEFSVDRCVDDYAALYRELI